MIKYTLFGKLNIKDIKVYFDSICKSTNTILKIKESCDFEVNIVDEKLIKSINRKYRKINKVTDVISFANRDNDSIKIPLLGEIYICLEKAKKQAKEYNHSLQRELCFLFTHGLLHLLGYDHMTKKDEKIMFNLTDKIINKAKLPSSCSKK